MTDRPWTPIPGKSILYRPHRGSLLDAMAEYTWLPGLPGLLIHLEATHPDYGPPFDMAGVSIKYYCEEDWRIRWINIGLVILSGWGPVGFVGHKRHDWDGRIRFSDGTASSPGLE